MLKRFSIAVSNLKIKTKKMKNEIGALFLAYKRSDVPWYAKVVILLAVGYALSPVDFIPDFIPVFGYIDDLILLPVIIALAVRLVPSDVMNECRRQSESIFKDGKPIGWIAGIVIICIWIIMISYILIRIFKSIL